MCPSITNIARGREAKVVVDMQERHLSTQNSSTSFAYECSLRSQVLCLSEGESCALTQPLI